MGEEKPQSIRNAHTSNRAQSHRCSLNQTGGAGRPGLRPLACDLNRVGRKERPALSSPTAASRLDRPIHRLQAGYRRLDFAAFRAPYRRLGGLPTNQPTLRTAAPRLPSEARCRPPPSSSPRRPHGSTSRGGCHHLPA